MSKKALLAAAILGLALSSAQGGAAQDMGAR